MGIVKNKDKRTGITYVYESESYWDKEKQQPRAHRRLIGKIDEATGEIVPTDGRGRKRKSKTSAEAGNTTPDLSYDKALREKDALIKNLRAENAALRKGRDRLLADLRHLVEKYPGN